MNPLRPDQQNSLRIFLACSIAILMISMGVRHTFGLFMPHMTAAYGWGRETFAFAIGLQNLLWGVAQPLTGALGDRFGAHKVLLAGALLYALGLGGMAFAATPVLFSLTCGVLIGVAHACTTYSTVFGAMGRRVSAEQRSRLMGLMSAAGSFGQFAMVPISQATIDGIGWSDTLLLFCGLVLLIAPLAAGMIEAPHTKAHATDRQTASAALREACSHKSFVLLVAGYFVCGFQVVFIGVHMPSFLKDAGLPAHAASVALALIGLFNIFGSYGAGMLGNLVPQRFILSSIYLSRSVVIAVFLAVPVSAASVYVFAALIGILWLSTVPPTNGIIARIFGVTHFSMLSGIAFFSHQIGSFLGVWLGGYWYDKVGNYQPVWILVIFLGILASVLHLPIAESPVKRKAYSVA